MWDRKIEDQLPVVPMEAMAPEAVARQKGVEFLGHGGGQGGIPNHRHGSKGRREDRGRRGGVGVDKGRFDTPPRAA